ncbi:STAS domain-containing protein [Streptomyces sp. NPDC054904]
MEQHQQPRTVVRVTGEMDQDRGRQLRTELHAALDRSRGDVTVDLSGLVFCDSSGLNALLAARLHAVEKGRVLRLAGPSRQMLRLLDLTGAKPLFPIDTTPPA